MTDLKMIMSVYRLPRHSARQVLHEIRKQPVFSSWWLKNIQQDYHRIYVGDKSGEESNPGRGLVNAD
jgi:hypothetical protein